MLAKLILLYSFWTEPWESMLLIISCILRYKITRNSVQFFVAITALSLSLFILCVFFLEEDKNRERESNGVKKCTEFRLIKVQNILEYPFAYIFYYKHGVRSIKLRKTSSFSYQTVLTTCLPNSGFLLSGALLK